jgi:hypothetical protein
MAKHKSVAHFPAAPATSSPAPRLAVQLFVTMGELIAVGLCILGAVTAAGWLIAGAEMRGKSTPTHPPRPTEWVCWIDRRYGEMCEPAYRSPPMRRHYARDGY